MKKIIDMLSPNDIKLLRTIIREETQDIREDIHDMKGEMRGMRVDIDDLKADMFDVKTDLRKQLSYILDTNLNMYTIRKDISDINETVEEHESILKRGRYTKGSKRTKLD